MASHLRFLKSVRLASIQHPKTCLLSQGGIINLCNSVFLLMLTFSTHDMHRSSRPQVRFSNVVSRWSICCFSLLLEKKNSLF